MVLNEIGITEGNYTYFSQKRTSQNPTWNDGKEDQQRPLTPWQNTPTGYT